MNKNELKGNLMLLLTAIIWGCAFVAQSTAMDDVGPFTFQAVRTLIGAVVLIPVIFFSDAMKKKEGTYKKADGKEKKVLIIGGIVCGIFLCVASNFQQMGIVTTDAGKAGFITAMYILLVPVFGLFLGKKVSGKIWACILLALAGLYFLCIVSNGVTDFRLAKGDILLIICAVLFSVHILVVDHFAPRVDGVRLSCIQFFVSGILSSVCMFAFETPRMSDLLNAAVPILYAGIGSCGIAYTLQILGQKHTKPAVASLIMSLESFFALVAQVIILRIKPSSPELIGCTLMFAAIIISQLPSRKKKSDMLNF